MNYVHSPLQEEPKLILPIAGQLNDALTVVKWRLTDLKSKGAADADAKSLLDNLEQVQPGLKDQLDGDVKFDPEYEGEEAVREALTYVNDVVRLLLHPLIQEDNEAAMQAATSILTQLGKIINFPTVLACFRHPKFAQYTADVGTLSLIDTPGPNEAMEGLGENSSFLLQVKQLVLQQVR